MIIVTGCKRSGTSMWMHVLVAAGLPYIGDRFPAGWGELLRHANPDGFFESELMSGINYRSNPHPLTGAYLHPAHTRTHAVKVFAPGLVRSDVAFIDRCLITVRSWREYVESVRRLGLEGLSMPPALEWWCNNYALIRDLAIRGYPAHVVTYASFLRDPARVAAEVLDWIGCGDAREAAAVVRPHAPQTRVRSTDAALADNIAPRHLEIFDELHEYLDRGRPLTARFIAALNDTDQALRPLVLERQAQLDAGTVADILGRR